MRIVIGVNVILSALIRDSTTRKIIIESGFEFYFPEPSLQKIRKYETYILEKSGLEKEELYEIISILFHYIKLVPQEQLGKNWNEAENIMNKIDPEDVIFIASALSINDSFIWTDDSDFQKQGIVKILKTSDMINLGS